MLLCEVDSFDMWVRVYLRIRSSNLNAKSEGLEADLEMKIERNMKGD